MPRPLLDANQSTSGLAVTSLTTASWTIADNQNRLLVAGSGVAAGAPPTFTEVRWGGAGGTLLTAVGAAQLFGTFNRNSAWRLVNPAAQTSTLYVLFSAAADECVLFGSSWYNVDQTSPISTDTRNTGSGASGVAATVGVQDAAVHDVVVDFVLAGNGGGGSSMTLAPAAQHNLLNEHENIDNFVAGAHGWSSGRPSVSVGWICSSNVTINWGEIAFAIRGIGPNYANARPWLDALLRRRRKNGRASFDVRNWF